MYRNEAGFQNVVQLRDIVLQIRVGKFLLVSSLPPWLCQYIQCLVLSIITKLRNTNRPMPLFSLFPYIRPEYIKVSNFSRKVCADSRNSYHICQNLMRPEQQRETLCTLHLYEVQLTQSQRPLMVRRSTLLH